MRLKIHFLLKLFFHFEFYRIIKDPIHLTHEPFLGDRKSRGTRSPETGSPGGPEVQVDRKSRWTGSPGGPEVQGDRKSRGTAAIIKDPIHLTHEPWVYVNHPL